MKNDNLDTDPTPCTPRTDATPCVSDVAQVAQHLMTLKLRAERASHPGASPSHTLPHSDTHTPPHPDTRVPVSPPPLAHSALPKGAISLSSSRRRGAQPGNHNAFKHGCYSRYYQIAGPAAFGAFENLNLNQQIELTRLYIRRLIENYQGSQGSIHATVILRAINQATHGLARLIRMRYFLTPSDALTALVRRTMELALQDFRSAHPGEPSRVLCTQTGRVLCTQTGRVLCTPEGGPFTPHTPDAHTPK